jgi:DNA-binding NarL/FixJ family response regulator
VRLVVCDDHRLFAEPLAFALEGRGHSVVVTLSPDDAVRAVDEDEPDMVLMDLRFPTGSGLEAVAEIHRWHPLCAVVVLSGSGDDNSAAVAAAAAGAAGFLRKDQPLSAVFAAVMRIAAGHDLLPPPPHADAGSHGRRLLGGLTERERQVLARLTKAEDTATIARSLGVAPSTARTHLQSLLHKLGVTTRLQAVTLVADAGLDVEW